MAVAGIDIGAGTAKMVIMSGNQVLAYSVKSIHGSVMRAIEDVTRDALDRAGLTLEGLDYTIGTGYGRAIVPFANETVTEITCAGRGANFATPEARLIIDIGAQDAKGIKIDENGNVVDFIMNDKCAAGTGRFIEVMANTLGLDLNEMGPLSMKSNQPTVISSTCTVFAETEIVSLRAQGKSEADLVAGIHRAIADRIETMVSQLGIVGKVGFIGGVAKNSGMKSALEHKMGVEILVPQDPQIVVATGAAIIAESRKH
jgi:(R)-2-hydroxyacyl-CoA dehydratese activating ATPase